MVQDVIRILALLSLAPLFLFQGRRVRATTPSLPEPEGRREGTQGQGEPHRLLILGDSAAAGVGVDWQDEALSGRLVAELAPCCRVHWRLEARNGRRVGDVLAGVGLPPKDHFHTIVISLGVNDVTAGTPVGRWGNQMEQLFSVLRQRYRPQRILMTAVPPMSRFPALPQPLRWYLGSRAAAMNRQLARRLDGQDLVELVEVPFTPVSDAMAVDGFHPGRAGYMEWARELASRIPVESAPTGERESADSGGTRATERQ